jgi:hypothetical protein
LCEGLPNTNRQVRQQRATLDEGSSWRRSASPCSRTTKAFKQRGRNSARRASDLRGISNTGLCRREFCSHSTQMICLYEECLQRPQLPAFQQAPTILFRMRMSSPGVSFIQASQGETEEPTEPFQNDPFQWSLTLYGGVRFPGRSLLIDLTGDRLI